MPSAMSLEHQEKDVERGQRQPWRSIRQQGQPAAAPKERVINYGYLKGTVMVEPGSAGEMNMTIIYDTAGDPSK